MRMVEIKHKDIHGVELQTPVKREKELEGSLRKITGLTLFSYNVKTGEMKKAVFLTKKHDYIVTSLQVKASDIQIRYVLVKEENCIYRQSLNLNSFQKYLGRQGLISLPYCAKSHFRGVGINNIS